jgi:hypothetical protein
MSWVRRRALDEFLAVLIESIESCNTLWLLNIRDFKMKYEQIPLCFCDCCSQTDASFLNISELEIRNARADGVSVR